jgi:hypothetical protein
MKPYDDLRNRIRSDWQVTLSGILQQARTTPRAVLAFDLDSTVFDNRPRQARIVREYGQAKGIPPLTACAPDHWTSGWDMRSAMINCGMSAEEVEQHYEDAKKFWTERFFTSAYCVDDIEVLGAGAFTRAVVETGATLAYLTGRHEEMREGSVQAMRNAGLALPDGQRVHLIMKPTLLEHDDVFKRDAQEQLKAWGTVIAAFDNEPTHANDYRRNFPEAKVIHLATDHSGRPVDLLEGIISVPHFQFG